ncbi:reverse transcriptase domain-containing protein [Tanacetum coccineum]
MLRACSHHGFTELTQVDTFYNGLNENDQDSLNAAAGGNLLSKTTREALNIIENKSKVRYSRNKSNVSRMNTTSRESVSKMDERIDKLRTRKNFLELAKIPLNENCSAMLLKKLLEKLRDPGKFLIPCNFLGMDKKLSLPELTPTRMTLELADRSITHPKGLAEDVFVKVGKFHFPTDFVVVDFEADPRVPLILGRSFLRTGHALIDVYGEEITIRVDNEAISFNLDQTTRYSSTNDKSVN